MLAATAVEGLRLYFLSAPLAGVNIMAATYFAATQQALPAQLLSLLRGLFLVVPAALLLSALWGVWGLWLALPAAELAAALVCAVLDVYKRQSQVYPLSESISEPRLATASSGPKNRPVPPS